MCGPMQLSITSSVSLVAPDGPSSGRQDSGSLTLALGQLRELTDENDAQQAEGQYD